MIPTIIKDKLLSQGSWNPDKNKNTFDEGYWIEHAGSLWAGQCNTQNTIEEIMEGGKQYEFDDHTSCRQMKSPETKLWDFCGNYNKLSNAFCVLIWNVKLAKKIQRQLRYYRKRRSHD